MKRYKNKKAQSALEYGVFIMALAAAIIGMQVFLKRSFQGKIRSISEDISPSFFDPEASGSWSVSLNSTANTTVIVQDSGTQRITSQYTNSSENTTHSEDFSIGGIQRGPEL
jgi:uncharacterized protein (UPF0333 family)